MLLGFCSNSVTAHLGLVYPCTISIMQGTVLSSSAEDTYRPKGEQIEVYGPELVLDAALCSILTVEKFNLSPLKHAAIEEYSDGDEYVIFLRNGLNLYYLSNGEQGFFLAKIISQHEPSRILVRKTMASAR